jgi:GMP synthase-like glutamine amidotransferase
VVQAFTREERSFMRIACLQHIEYEGPGAIAMWAHDRGHTLETIAPLFERYPGMDDLDMLVVLGGPMGAYEDAAYPWLVSEKRFIHEAVDAGKLVFGVCLGAQLIASAMGGDAHPHAAREVGWFPARLTDAGRASRVLSVLPDECVVGLWHGDTYDLPEGVETAMTTEACANQAFEMRDGRVVGVQFHLEWTDDALRGLARRHGDWLESGGPYVQTRERFLHPGRALGRGAESLHDLLDAMEARL